VITSPSPPDRAAEAAPRQVHCQPRSTSTWTPPTIHHGRSRHALQRYFGNTSTSHWSSASRPLNIFSRLAPSAERCTPAGRRRRPDAGGQRPAQGASRHPDPSPRPTPASAKHADVRGVRAERPDLHPSASPQVRLKSSPKGTHAGRSGRYGQTCKKRTPVRAYPTNATRPCSRTVIGPKPSATAAHQPRFVVTPPASARRSRQAVTTTKSKGARRAEDGRAKTGAQDRHQLPPVSWPTSFAAAMHRRRFNLINAVRG